MLYNSTIFGPIKSRRLGCSLGVNITPNFGKICSFDCVYCEAGLNKDGRGDQHLASIEQVAHDLEEFLQKPDAPKLDSITFSGNGEPTLHPNFEEIVDVVVALRNKYQPKAKISVLSNAWHLDSESVCRALSKIDNNILKLDSAVPETLLLINRPCSGKVDMQALLNNIAKFKGNFILQTLFFKAPTFSNLTENEVNAWLKAVEYIKPKMVQVYTLDRKTPIEGLEAATPDFLQNIALKVKAFGIDAVGY